VIEGLAKQIARRISDSQELDSVHWRLGTGVAFTVVGGVFNQGSTIAVNIFVAHVLGKKVFGQYAVILATIATATALVSFSLASTTAKFVAEFRSVDTRKAGRILSLSAALSAAVAVACGVGLFAVSPWIAVSVLHLPELTMPLRIASAVAFIALFNGFLAASLAGLEAYAALGRAYVVGGTFYFAICALAAWYGGLRLTIGGLAVSGVILSVALVISLKRECSRQGIILGIHGIGAERKMLYGFGVPAALGGILAQASFWVSSAFLARQPAGLEQMASFSAANTFRTALLFLPGMILTVAASMLNNHKGLGQMLRYWSLFRSTMLSNISIVVAGGGLMALVGPRLLRIFGKSFGDGVPVLEILLLVAVMDVIHQTASQVVISHNRLWTALFAATLPHEIILLSASYWWVPRWGAVGLALAHAVALLVAASASLLLVRSISRQQGTWETAASIVPSPSGDGCNG
jgi:O-antigen/teichoic acid export membrane protein